MNIKYLLLICGIGFISQSLVAQTTEKELREDINKTGGIYYAYPAQTNQNTQAPEGYTPFYISHYGRHGSRYLISDSDYTRTINLLHKADEAGALTPLGKDVMVRLDSVYLETAKRAGDLSPLGVRQHKAIAKRMYEAYPEVFRDSTPISARSTIVVRCVLSMDAFCEALKEMNPSLDITRESSQRYMDYLNYHTQESNDWYDAEFKEESRKFEEKMTKPERLVNSLFSDKEFIRKFVNPHNLMWDLYFIAVGMQNIETDISFYDIFLPEELFDIWQAFSFRFYGGSGNYAGNNGLEIANAGNLLSNIIETADNVISSGGTAATLRFGHDGNLIPLAGILDLKSAIGKTGNPDEAYKYFADFKVAPMAGNVQMVFFRNDNDPNAPILIKILLNEEEQELPLDTEIWPYYNWQDVRDHYLKKLH